MGIDRPPSLMRNDGLAHLPVREAMLAYGLFVAFPAVAAAFDSPALVGLLLLAPGAATLLVLAYRAASTASRSSGERSMSSRG